MSAVGRRCNAPVELERQFDCQLVDRIGKSLRRGSPRGPLPLAGNLLDQHARSSPDRPAAAWLRSPLVRTLTIGNYLATLVIAEYMRQHPEAPVSLQVANTQSIVELAGLRLIVTSG